MIGDVGHWKLLASNIQHKVTLEHCYHDKC
jgi:hypothetical protein